MMRRSQKSTPKKNNSSYRASSTARGKEAQELKNIMTSIKFLQHKVNNLPVHGPRKKSIKLIAPITPKASVKVNNSQSKYFTGSGKSQPKREKSTKTKLKLELNPKIHSAKLNCESQTFLIKSPLVQNPISFESAGKPQIMQNYMSLQLQNFKLQKNNLNLEKQILEQSLMIERREKQLLKNRLKRIKTHHNQNNQKAQYQVPQTDQTQTPAVSSFNVSPIKIKIPELSHKQSLQNRYKIFTKADFETNRRSNIKVEDEADSLLLSQENESCLKLSPQKTTESVLQQQLWDMLGHTSQKQNKGPIRQALGDIANRLKVVRNK